MVKIMRIKLAFLRYFWCVTNRDPDIFLSLHISNMQHSTILKTVVHYMSAAL